MELLEFGIIVKNNKKKKQQKQQQQKQPSNKTLLTRKPWWYDRGHQPTIDEIKQYRTTVDHPLPLLLLYTCAW